jgi:general secretion pathway protein L
MKALFFIEIPTHLPTEELVYHWYKEDLTNESQGCDVLAEIKNQSVDCDVILVFPGFNITQKQISSKLKNRKKLELAIAYELEEVLSEEIESLFFAYHPTQDKNKLDVAIVNKAWFEKWLEVFKQHSIPLTAAITDTMLLKKRTEDYLLIKKTHYYLLKVLSATYAIDTENIAYFLTQENLPEELQILTQASEPQIMEKFPVKVKTIPIQQGILKLLLEQYQLGSDFNLLQGVYKPKLKNDWQKIKWGTVALFSLFLLATLFQTYQHWQLAAQETKLDQQRLKIFQQSFPEIKKIINPLVQMKNALETRKQNQQQQGQFMSLLAKVSIALRDLLTQQQVTLLGLEFDNNVLVVRLKANSFALIAQIKQNLQKQQLNVQESSEKIENQINASFTLSGNNE